MIGAITGGIAQAFYGVPAWVQDRVYAILDKRFAAVTREFMPKADRVGRIKPKSGSEAR